MKGFFLILCSVILLSGIGSNVTQLDHIDLVQGLTLTLWTVASLALGLLGAIYIHEGR